jgi:hypothetical protein
VGPVGPFCPTIPNGLLSDISTVNGVSFNNKTLTVYNWFVLPVTLIKFLKLLLITISSTSK